MKYIIYLIIPLSIISCKGDYKDTETVSSIKGNCRIIRDMNVEILEHLQILASRRDSEEIGKLSGRLDKIISSYLDTSITAEKTNEHSVKETVEICYKDYRSCLDTLLMAFNLANIDEKRHVALILDQPFQYLSSQSNSVELNRFLTWQRILFQHNEILRRIRRVFIKTMCGPDKFMNQITYVQTTGDISKIDFSFYFEKNKLWVPTSLVSITTADRNDIGLIKTVVGKNKLTVETKKLDPDRYVARLKGFLIDETGEKWEQEMDFYFNVSK